MTSTTTGENDINKYANEKGAFVRQESKMRNFIAKDGPYPPEANRYHLYISYACPWAHRTLIVRNLKGLQSIIGLSVVDWLLGKDGWAFTEREDCIPDTVNNFKFVKEIYFQTDPNYSARFTVPVLYDKKTKTIVNNESSEIIRMLNTEFNEFSSAPELDLYPEALRPKIDELNEMIYEGINNGVYKAGFATAQDVYEQNARLVYETLLKVEGLLEKNKFVCGDVMTETDIRLFTSIIRFDIVYYSHFKCNLVAVRDLPHLSRWLKDFYEIPIIKDTVNVQHIKKCYYMSQLQINPTAIVPLYNGPLVMTAPSVTLNNGNKMPCIGLGTGTRDDRGAMYQATRDAISAGYRHIDTAAFYETEPFVGQAVKDAITSGEVKREDLFITTKLWMNRMKREHVIPALRESLKHLQLDYVDLYLIHWPTAVDANDVFGAADIHFDNELNIYTQTWPAMEEAVALGLAKNIGVSNFNSKQIDELLKVANIAPVVNQVECHPFLSQRKLIDHCSKYRIRLTAYSPLGGTPIANEGDKTITRSNFNVRKGLFDNETVTAIAKRHGKNVGQILLKFQVQRGLIVIPKSVTKSRIVDNLNIFDFELTKEELSQLEALNQNLRYIHVTGMKNHVNYPFNAEY